MAVPLYISYITLLMFLTGKLKITTQTSFGFFFGFLFSFFFLQCLSQTKAVVFFLLLRSATAKLGKLAVITSEKASQNETNCSAFLFFFFFNCMHNIPWI